MNPGVVRLANGNIAMIYRGCGSNNIGHLGFCMLDSEGRKVIAKTRSRRPLNKRLPSEKQEFPGGYGDPRINKVDYWYYIWANGRNNSALQKSRLKYGNDFGGQYIGGRQTVAFRTKDFKSLEYLGLHGPDEFDKNSFLHPNKITINNKYYWAFFHRIQYSIQVILVEKIGDLKKRKIWNDHIEKIKNYTLLEPIFDWEGVAPEYNWPGSVSGGSPPLQINWQLVKNGQPNKKYWILFYNASGKPRDGKIAKDRKTGAIIYTLKDQLDLKGQPFKIIARTPKPILEPKKSYELNSPNGDVVFITGSLITPDKQSVDLFYGSGDIRISKARFDLVSLVSYISNFDARGKIVNS